MSTTARRPVVSVVVVVKNDRRIARLLECLERLPESQPREVVIVDASAGELDDISSAHPGVRWIPFTPTSSISVAEQRNIGVNEACGDVIVFVDADCLPVGDWLEALVSPILDGSEKLVAGAIRSQEGSSSHDWHWDKYTSTRVYLDEARTGNLAVHRQVFAQHGQFDEGMRYGSDGEFTMRAAANGTPIRFVPEAIVLHEWGGLRANVRRAFLYGEAHARLHKRHRWTRRRLLGQDFVYPAYAVFLVGLPLSTVFWGYPLLLVVPLVKNRNNRPFHVVSLNLVHGVGYLRELVAPAR